MRTSKPLQLSKDPKKANVRMSDVQCLICGRTLFIDDSNPCGGCEYISINERLKFD